MTAYDDYLVAREVEKATVPGRWFQAIDEDGNLLAETSNPRARSEYPRHKPDPREC